MFAASDPMDDWGIAYSKSIQNKGNVTVDPWSALAAYVAAPAKGKTIYEPAAKQNNTAKTFAITGGILAVGALAFFLAMRK